VAARPGIGGVAIIGHGVDVMISISACLTAAASPVGVRCEAGEDLVDAAQRAPVDQSLLLVTHCPCPASTACEAWPAAVASAPAVSTR
jgi:hypothetical protein